MDKAKVTKKQSAQVATSKPDDAQTETDALTQPENSDGGDTEDAFSSDSQSNNSATSQYCLRLRRMRRAIKVIYFTVIPFNLPDLKQSSQLLGIR